MQTILGMILMMLSAVFLIFVYTHVINGDLSGYYTAIVSDGVFEKVIKLFSFR